MLLPAYGFRYLIISRIDGDIGLSRYPSAWY
jgi:hypothetical protein